MNMKIVQKNTAQPVVVPVMPIGVQNRKPIVQHWAIPSQPANVQAAI